MRRSADKREKAALLGGLGGLLGFLRQEAVLPAELVEDGQEGEELGGIGDDPGDRVAGEEHIDGMEPGDWKMV